jgi:hypothetical protein
VGEGAQIAAGSLVLKPVAPHTMVAGSPAKVVGHVTGAWSGHACAESCFFRRDYCYRSTCRHTTRVVIPFRRSLHILPTCSVAGVAASLWVLLLFVCPCCGC